MSQELISKGKQLRRITRHQTVLWDHKTQHACGKALFRLQWLTKQTVPRVSVTHGATEGSLGLQQPHTNMTLTEAPF